MRFVFGLQRMLLLTINDVNRFYSHLPKVIFNAVIMWRRHLPTVTRHHYMIHAMFDVCFFMYCHVISLKSRCFLD
jgi:hypothetical protein